MPVGDGSYGKLLQKGRINVILKILKIKLKYTLSSYYNFCESHDILNNCDLHSFSFMLATYLFHSLIKDESLPPLFSHCPQYIFSFFVFKLQTTCLGSTTRVSAFTLKLSGRIHKVVQKKSKTNSLSLASVVCLVLNKNRTIDQIFISLSGLSIFSLYLSFLLYREINSIPMLVYISR